MVCDLCLAHYTDMNTYDNEKPSEKRQWREKSSRPVIVRPMTQADIEDHRQNLIKSYECEDSAISYAFERIRDENDEDRDDCLMLIYKLKCVIARKPANKVIFTLKVPIPPEIKQQAEELRKQKINAQANMQNDSRSSTQSNTQSNTQNVAQGDVRSSTVDFPAPTIQIEDITEEDNNEEIKVRPVVKKPVRRKK